MTLYLDTSGLAKLLVEEAGTQSLRELIAGHARVVASALAEIELMRVAHRISDDLVPQARDILDSLHIAAITPPIIRSAGNLLPGTSLRSLDAIHLATAIALPDLVTVCTYDTRMLAAAASLGLPTTPAPRCCAGKTAASTEPTGHDEDPKRQADSGISKCPKPSSLRSTTSEGWGS